MMFLCLPFLDPLAGAAAVSQKWQIGSPLWFQSGKQMEFFGLHPSQSRRVNAAEPKGATYEQSSTQLEDQSFWLSGTWRLYAKTVCRNLLSTVGASKANLLIVERMASLLCVTLPVFMGHLRQAVELLWEPRCATQKTASWGNGCLERWKLGRWFISQVPEAINHFHCLSQRALGFPHGSVKAQISSWGAKYCWQHMLFEQQHLPHSWQGCKPAEGLIHSPVFAFTWVWRSSSFTFSNLWI